MQLKLRDGTAIPRMRGGHNRRRMLVQARAELVQAGRALFEGVDDRGLTADEKQQDDQTRAAIEWIDAELAFENQQRERELGLPVVLTPSGDGLGHGHVPGTSEGPIVIGATADGREIRGFRQQDAIANDLSPQASEANRVRLGSIVRHMVTGDPRDFERAGVRAEATGTRTTRRASCAG